MTETQDVFYADAVKEVNRREEYGAIRPENSQALQK
jgi:hypothetical protein